MRLVTESWFDIRTSCYLGASKVPRQYISKLLPPRLQRLRQIVRQRTSSVETKWLVGLLSLSFGFAAIADVVFWAAVISMAGAQAGAAGGLMNTGGNFGGAIAPFLTPLIASSYGWSAGLYVGAAAALLGAVAWSRIDASPPVPTGLQTTNSPLTGR